MVNLKDILKEREDLYEEITQTMEKQLKEHSEKMNALEAERIRIEGEHRLLVSLIEAESENKEEAIEAEVENA